MPSTPPAAIVPLSTFKLSMLPKAMFINRFPHRVPRTDGEFATLTTQFMIAIVRRSTPTVCAAKRSVVGYHSITLYNIMPSAVRIFRECYPDVEVVLQEMISPALEEALESGAVDIGLAGLSGIGARVLDYEILYRDTVAVALPKGHALESCTSIPLAALAGEPFVMYSRVQKKQGFDQIIALCQSRGFSPHIVQEAATESAVISLVAGGIGIAIVENSLQRVRADEVSYRMLVEPVVEANFGVAWKRNSPSPIVQAFIQTVHDIAHNDVVGSSSF
jgi:DNA-binding transcriptional LysR family regulator